MSSEVVNWGSWHFHESRHPLATVTLKILATLPIRCLLSSIYIYLRYSQSEVITVKIDVMLRIQASGTRGLFAVPINTLDLIPANHRVPSPLTAVKVVHCVRKKNQSLYDKYRSVVFHAV